MELSLNKLNIGDYSIAARALHVIHDNSERLDIVMALQRYVIRSIWRCERRIGRLRRARARLKRRKSVARLSRDESRFLKSLTIRLDDRVTDLKQQIFLWRCFVDGIAFIYQSKYALKHLFYDKNYIPKQSPGFVSENRGFRKEYKLLCKGIRMGVPVVMADLTNTIRHGDICALAGADPLPVEVKSSVNGNARIGRQIADLNELASFFANDGAKNFRGNPNTIRQELSLPEIDHREKINACISSAVVSGFSMVEPEEGLFYLAFTNEFSARNDEVFWGHLFSTMDCRGICTTLTPDPTWVPLYPFTLSLSPDNLIPFITRHVVVMVLVNMITLKRKFMENEVHAIGIMDGTSALQICLDPTDLA